MKKILLIIAAIFCCTIGVNAQETPDYFCLTINIESGYSRTLYFYRSISTWTIPSLEYKLNDGEWTEIQISSGTYKGLDLAVGESKVYLRAKGTGEEGNKTFSENKDNYFYLGMPSNATTTVVASGNIMSLLDRDNFENLNSVPSFAFFRFFNGSSSSKNTKLIDASQLRLPATELSSQCYAYMFNLCSALTAAPALPATALADSCYYSMFNTCSSLTVAPTLPATELKKYCYSNMFSSCSGLTSMEVSFTEWPTSTWVKEEDRPSDYYATYNWVSSVAASGTFTCPEDLPKTYDSSKIPTGWTVEHPTNYITLNDNEPYTGTKDRTATVTYNRNFESTVWQPLYVPFSIKITEDLLQDCDIADIFMVSTKGSVTAGDDPVDEGLSVTVIKKFIEGDQTEPHTPYFIRPKATGDFEFTQEKTTVYAAKEGMVDCSTTKDKYEFIGNYSAKTLSPTTGIAFYVLGTSGGLKPVAKTADYDLAANRWYMQKKSKSGTVALDADEKMSVIVLGEDDTTGIEGIEASPKSSPEGKDLYNLQGQRVNTFNGYRGMVVKGGKKFIVK